jgi:hypothetical protein
LAAGATIASANTAAATSSAYSAGVVAGASTAATSSAYNAGVAAGSANTAAAYNAGVAAAGTTPAYAAATVTPSAGPSNYAMGGIYPTLPVGCISPKVQGMTYYLCGNTWFQPSYGANGVSYRVVPAP